MTDRIGPISELGRRYLDGELKQQSLEGEIQLSDREDVPRLEDFTIDDMQGFARAALETLRSGQVAFGVLAAGASSRMSLQQLPPEVAVLLERSGQTEVPSSKALVPVLEMGERVLSYLDLFLINVRRFKEQTGARGPAVLFVSELNRDEIVEHLRRVQYEGLEPADVWDFQQPLESQIVASEQDVRRGESNLPPDDLPAIYEFSRQYAGHELPQKKPAGHGEFLHQMVASGMLARLLQRGVQFISVRNIDNAAAVLDDRWVHALGLLIDQDGDILVEVSQRPEGQKGGALIRKSGDWRLAEDPSFRGTSYKANDSYYINNAVAIMRLRYLLKIYDTSVDEQLQVLQLEPAEHAARLSEIAARGKRRFPTLVDAKPLMLEDGRVVAAVIPETNMWESTGVAEGLRVVPLAVDSDRDADALLTKSGAAQRKMALRVRFSPTKNWNDYLDQKKQTIAGYIAERIIHGPLFPAESE